MERPIAHLIPELTSNIIGALAVWVYMMIVDWRMGLICLISVPVGLLFFGFIASSYAEDYRQSVEITQDMNASIVEYVHGIEVIKAYNQRKSSYQKFKDKVMANAAFYCYWMKKTEVCQSLCYTIAPCTLITVLPVGWYMYISGEITADVLMTSIMLSMCIVGPILSAVSLTFSDYRSSIDYKNSLNVFIDIRILERRREYEKDRSCISYYFIAYDNDILCRIE